MKKETLASILNGRQYRNEISKEECLLAKKAGLIVIFGASDDLIEFRGVVDDEAGSGGHDDFIFTEKGLLSKPIQDDMDEEDFEEQFLEYVEAKKRGNKVTAKFSEQGYSWIYETDIPHATFDIMEDDEKYCRGIVIDTIDLE